MMSRNRARSVLAACLLSAAITTGTRAEAPLIWTEKAGEGMISLSYGAVDPSVQPTLLLSCFNEMGVAALDIFGAIEGARPGEKLTIAFAAGSTHKIEGEAALDDKTGALYAEASSFEVKPLIAVLKAAGPLTVTMAATTLTLSDTGRAEAVEKFGKDCELD
jgi:hypothetical protein